MRRLAVPITLAAFAASASTAGATLVVQKSLAGVSLGASESGVVTTLGTPRKSIDLGSAGNPAGQPQKRLDYGLTDVTITGGVVTEIATTSKLQRTAANVGVGTSEHRLKTKISGLKCHGAGSRRFCYKGSLLPGKPITTFDISAKKTVKRVSLATVID